MRYYNNIWSFNSQIWCFLFPGFEYCKSVVGHLALWHSQPTGLNLVFLVDDVVKRCSMLQDILVYEELTYFVWTFLRREYLLTPLFLKFLWFKLLKFKWCVNNWTNNQTKPRLAEQTSVLEYRNRGGLKYKEHRTNWQYSS